MTENITQLMYGMMPFGEESNYHLSDVLPSALVGYETPITVIVVIAVLLVVFDLYCRSKMNRKCHINPKKFPSDPLVIPFNDPLWTIFDFFRKLFTGKGKDLRHPKALSDQSLVMEKKNNGCKCIQQLFLGWPIVVTWDADHFRDVSTNTEDYGKALGFSKGFDDISRRSILFVEGQEWKDQKRLIHPAFQFTHIKNQIPKFNDIARLFTSQLGKIDGPVEMMPWTSKATLDGLSMAGFGLDMGSLLDKNTEAYKLYRGAVGRFADPWAMMPGIESLPIEYNRKWFENIRNYVKYLSDLVGEKRLKMLEEERAGQEREDKDILDLLISARDEDDSTGLTEEELIHNVNIFYLAGHETSASTLAFAAHMLAEHPDLQERMYQEIQTVLGDRDPSNDDFPSLKFTTNFLKEVGRLYPVAVGVIRMAKKDVVMGNYAIDKGTMVMLSTYTTHRHPGYWEKPDEFWPDRFLPENSKGRHPFAYTPFSAGPRACIGKQFALIEMKILLIHLVRTFTVSKSPDQTTPFEDDIGVVLRPPVGATVVLKKRE